MTIPNPKTPVTAWYQKEPVIKKAPVKEKYFFYFNHIENGHATGNTPADPFDLKWHKGTWEKLHGYLEDQGAGLPPKLDLLAKPHFEVKESLDEAD